MNAATAAKNTAALTDLRARRVAALAVMRKAANEGKHISLDETILSARAKSWIRSCGLAGDVFAPTLAIEFKSAHKARLVK